MWNQILTQLQTNGLVLITMGGNISPYFGAAIALILAAALMYVSYKAKAEAWQDEKKDSGTTIGSETGQSQNTATGTINGTDDWMNKK